jgi:hypothetical protein
MDFLSIGFVPDATTREPSSHSFFPSSVRGESDAHNIETLEL